MGKWRLGKYKHILSCNVQNIRQRSDTFDLLHHRRRHAVLKKKHLWQDGNMTFNLTLMVPCRLHA